MIRKIVFGKKTRGGNHNAGENNRGRQRGEIRKGGGKRSKIGTRKKKKKLAGRYLSRDAEHFWVREDASEAGGDGLLGNSFTEENR